MPERLTLIALLLSLALSLVICSSPDNEENEDEYEPELRGFNEYETWKPTAQSSIPEVILIKQKDPYHSDSDHHAMSSITSAIKHHLPLLAVLAPLVAVSVLLPLKAYLGPSYVVYPPVVAPPPADAPDTKRDRVGKAENEVLEDQSLAAQVMNMIEEIDKVYGEMAANDED